MLPARPRPTQGQDLATLSCVEGKANAALFGPPWAGTTHIAVALAVAACRSGYPICFTSLDDMVRFAGRDLAWVYFRTTVTRGPSPCHQAPHRSRPRDRPAARPVRPDQPRRNPLTDDLHSRPPPHTSYSARYGFVLPAIKVAQQGNLGTVMDQLPIDAPKHPPITDRDRFTEVVAEPLFRQRLSSALGGTPGRGVSDVHEMRQHPRTPMRMLPLQADPTSYWMLHGADGRDRWASEPVGPGPSGRPSVWPSGATRGGGGRRPRSRRRRR